VQFLCAPNQNASLAPFRAFIEYYFLKSKKECLVLGPQETETRYMITSAHSIIEVWRRLIASAEWHIIKGKEPDPACPPEKWKLKWVSEEEVERKGPGYRIVCVRATPYGSPNFTKWFLIL
jgi:hypothetical protein